MLSALHQRLKEEGTVSLMVRVHPGARRTCVKGTMADGTIKIDITAAPEDGKANAQLVRFLAREFSVPLSHVEIVRGQTGRTKTVRITG